MFEYKVLVSEVIPYTAELNRLGKEGWKMCGAYITPSSKIGGVNHVTIFVREIEPT